MIIQVMTAAILTPSGQETSIRWWYNFPELQTIAVIPSNRVKGVLQR